MPKFNKKSDGSEVSAWQACVRDYEKKDLPVWAINRIVRSGELSVRFVVPIGNGTLYAEEGDWIVRHEDGGVGRLEVLANWEFDKEYE